jgi:membrane protein implicated in regulation of membrane protease activity
MSIVLVIVAIAAVGLISSRFSDRTVDLFLLIACATGAVAWVADSPHGLDYVVSTVFALAAVFLALRPFKDRHEREPAGGFH